MKVEIVTIGDELLLGFTIDTNAAYLARELAAFGVEVARRATCGDSAEEIASAVRDALYRTGAVITTGGLGPTADDITKASIAALFGREMYLDEQLAEGLRQRWRAYRRTGELPQSNYVQAMIPQGATILANHRGSAPGIFLEDEQGRWVAMLPGVPTEARGMFDDTLRPLIEARVHRESVEPLVVASHTVRTIGVAESMLADQLGDLGKGFDDMSLAFLPNLDGVDLRLTVHNYPQRQAASQLAMGALRLRSVLGDAVYGENGVSLASVVLDDCRRHNVRLAVAESCTGGLLGARITDVPGASDIFHGGLIAYDNRVKRQLLGVVDEDLNTHGAVSERVALQMAKGIRLRLGTEIGLSVTGIAGPGGGTAEKPVGTVWIAADIAEGRPPIPRPEGYPPLTPSARARVFHFIGARDEIRHRATQSALDMVRRVLAEAAPAD